MEHAANPAKLTEVELDRALRPTHFDGFRGQEQVKLNLQVAVAAAKKRGTPLDHLLISGPPGLGKTTMAAIVAAELGANLVVVNAPSIKTKGELASLLASLNEGDILFLDEIHSLNPKVEEILYPATEDYKLEVVAGNKAITIKLKPFTLIGATTRAGMLQRPMRDRFGIVAEMKPYSVSELVDIVLDSSRKLGVSCSRSAADEIAARSHGTPRLANRLLRRVQDTVDAYGRSGILTGEVYETCERIGIDNFGLDSSTRGYLQILCDKGQPLALSSVVALTGESKDLVEEVIEPVLMRLGLIEKTPKGRVVTAKGRQHIQTEH
ncbi:MAG TPA: Holliday junction branch migration DNA helicase RuvB [Methylobacter sp.]|jgi:Holliday junction DNA helicase RuvB